jgi:hypothetical protein
MSMETDRPSATTSAPAAPVVTHPGSNDTVDASLPKADWDCVLQLRRAGVTDAGLYRLLRLRTTYRTSVTPAADGLERDARALFARWLVAHGVLHEGPDTARVAARTLE